MESLEVVFEFFASSSDVNHMTRILTDPTAHLQLPNFQHVPQIFIFIFTQISMCCQSADAKGKCQRNADDSHTKGS